MDKDKDEENPIGMVLYGVHRDETLAWDIGIELKETNLEDIIVKEYMGRPAPSPVQLQKVGIRDSELFKKLSVEPIYEFNKECEKEYGIKFALDLHNSEESDLPFKADITCPTNIDIELEEILKDITDEYYEEGGETYLAAYLPGGVTPIPFTIEYGFGNIKKDEAMSFTKEVINALSSYFKTNKTR